MRNILFFSLPVLFIFLLSCNGGERRAGSEERSAGSGVRDSLLVQVERIAAEAQGRVGVAMKLFETGDTFFYNGDMHMTMQSTYKFPLAMYALHLADSGKLSLNKMIHISAKELDQDTWSPIADSFEHGVSLSVKEIMTYMVSMSDNIACDIMFRETGGTAKTNDYIHSLGVKDISIAATEGEMHANHATQYTNWCTARAMLQLLDIFHYKQALSDSNDKLLWTMMYKSKNSPKRIMGLLPAGAVVAHKTGTGFTENGMVSAVNDIGIITLPGDKHLAIVVFISDAKNTDISKLEDIIARIAKAGYDRFNLR